LCAVIVGQCLLPERHKMISHFKAVHFATCRRC
jgi:hypothetical protein